MKNKVLVTAISQIFPGCDNSKEYYIKNTNILNRQSLEQALGKRFSKKRDKSTNSAIIVSKELLSRSKHMDLNRTGIMLGNTLGGWDYVDEQLKDLYLKDDLSVINPYVATAWFPTASQGELSILGTIVGYSKTFCGGELSSAFALKHAYDSIISGKLSSAIVGGVEAPNTKLIHNVISNEKNLVDGCILFTVESNCDCLEEVLLEIEMISIRRSLKEIVDMIDESERVYLYTDVTISNDLLDKTVDYIESFSMDDGLFSLKIPKLILDLYNRFKNQSKKVTVLTKDDDQYLIMTLKIM